MAGKVVNLRFELLNKLVATREESASKATTSHIRGTLATIMKKLFTILLIIISSSVIGQPFQFTDSVFSENQFIVLYQIDFEFGKENLKTEQIQLDSLVNFLKKHDTLKFEIGVHTGFRGDEKYNLAISKDRANTLCNFLIENKIDRSRMTCIGYGENKSVIEFEDWEKIADIHRCGYYERGNRRITVVIK